MKPAASLARLLEEVRAKNCAKTRAAKAARRAERIHRNNEQYYRRTLMRSIPKGEPDEAAALREMGAPRPSLGSTLEPGRVFHTPFVLR